MNVLEEANSIVHGPRNEAYGHPYDNHGLTAKYWNIYLIGKYGKTDGTITAEDVCFLNILQKISRAQNSLELNKDSLVDIAGYAANIEMIQKRKLLLEEPETKTV